MKPSSPSSVKQVAESVDINTGISFDFATFKDMVTVTVYGAHDAAKALREISKEARNWSDGGPGGLRVIARDGDARDRRQRDEFEEFRRLREEEQAEHSGEDADGHL